jgi:putative transposase
LLQQRRGKTAAKRFFKNVRSSNPVSRKIVTDQLRSDPAAKADIPELVNVRHVLVKAAARVNDRAENSPRGSARGASEAFATRSARRHSCRASVRAAQRFALKRHLMRASLYRKHLAARFVTCRELTNVAQTLSNAF